jgi:hypothetical protein
LPLQSLPIRGSGGVLDRPRFPKGGLHYSKSRFVRRQPLQ